MHINLVTFTNKYLQFYIGIIITIFVSFYKIQK